MYFCGKCGSTNLYRDDDTLNELKYIACLTCGNRFPPGPEPITKEEAIKKEDVMAKKGTCVNCERPDMQLPAFGRCHLCYAVARKAEKAGATAEEIQAALAEASERVKRGENLKSRSGKKNGKVSEVSDTKKPVPKPVEYKAAGDRVRITGGADAHLVYPWAPDKISIEALSSRAEKALDLKGVFDETFQGNADIHLKMVIMAAIFDAYRDGYEAHAEFGG